ncbi:hypothetical protein jhhlp_003312 [Lomentospora prolificans]|uniref:Altered inheritance of mitochondria protein 21 n=1 Tax=Lomentospora prolificans TaxID=41688 RepID=A0A2N3NGL8_9PEZI|nr:hypothetical protein jhhlp_003312 [Lomentospora prolificans]
MSTANDIKMSSDELNQIVHNTANRHGLATSEYEGTPSEEVGFEGQEAYVSRIASPRSGFASLKTDSPPKGPSPSEEEPPEVFTTDEDIIHVDEPRRSASPEDVRATGRHHYTAPILAEDEVAKSPPRFELHAAIEPSVDAAVEDEEPLTEPIRRHSINTEVLPSDFPRPEARKVPVHPQEYEALFKDGEEQAIEDEEEKPSKRDSLIHKFPSKDIWEDAPSSVHYTTEVSTPDVSGNEPHLKVTEPPERNNPTPVQAFAQYQEELAEKEAQRTKNFVPRGEKPSQSWLPLQEPPQVPATRPAGQRRFPSRDVWEDAPDSHLHEATVSSDQQPETKPDQPQIPARPAKSVEKPAIPERPARGGEPPAIPGRPARKNSDKPALPERPAIPDRPKPKKESSSEGKPTISDKPKPQIPPRPTKASSVSPVEATEHPALSKNRPSIPVRPAKPAAAATTEAKEPPAVPKAKPAIPARPMGNKIAALQAGFMSDLNRRLQLGPQAPKKEEPEPEAAAEEEKPIEKKPLADARKGRARGPQRRAPAKSPAPPAAAAAATSPEPAKPSAPSLSFSLPQTVWSLDPEGSDLVVKSTEPIESAPKSVAEPLKDEPLTRESTPVSAEKESSPVLSEPEPAKATPASEESATFQAEEAAATIPDSPKLDLAEEKALEDEPVLDAIPTAEVGSKIEAPEIDAGEVALDKAGNDEVPIEKPSAIGAIDTDKSLDVKDVKA